MQKAVGRQKEIDHPYRSDPVKAVDPPFLVFCLLPPAFCLLLSLCLRG
jgi:hypothetical protein